MRYAVVINNAVTEFREYASAPDSALGPDNLPVLREVFTSRDAFNKRIHTQSRTVRVEPERVVERFESVPRPIEDVRAEVVAEIKREAFNRLMPTEWMVTRQYETGKPVPTAISQLRADIRAASDAFEAVVGSMALDALGAWVRKWPGD